MKNLNNHSGFAILQALMVTVVVGISAGFILSQMRLTETTLIIPRIRSEMLVAESAFRNMAYMSNIYWCDNISGASGCAPSGPASDLLPGNPAGADPNIADTYLQQFESNLPSCTPSPCGIKYNIGGPRYTFTTYTTTAADFAANLYPAAGLTIYRLNTRIVYEGTGVAGKIVSVAPVNITVDIPEHILTGAPFRCAAQDATRPFFRGFNANGTPNCTGWIGANQTNGRCDKGYYIKSFDANNMTINCELLRSTDLAGTNTCPITHVMGNIDWNVGDGNVALTCTLRTNAFTYFSYNPYSSVTEVP